MFDEQRSPIAPPIPPLKFGGSLQEQVEAGAQIEALVESQAFGILRAAIKQAQDRLVSVELMAKRSTWNGAEYAGAVGKLNGLAMVEPIAAAVIQAGKQAASKLRAVEDEGEF